MRPEPPEELPLPLLQVPPAQLAAQRREEGLTGEADEAEGVRGTLDDEAVAGDEVGGLLPVDGEDELLRGGEHLDGDLLRGGEDERAHRQRVRADGRGDDAVDARGDDGAAGGEGVGGGAGGGS